jgi:hypothetical protein
MEWNEKPSSSNFCFQLSRFLTARRSIYDPELWNEEEEPNPPLLTLLLTEPMEWEEVPPSRSPAKRPALTG